MKSTKPHPLESVVWNAFAEKDAHDGSSLGYFLAGAHVRGGSKAYRTVALDVLGYMTDQRFLKRRRQQFKDFCGPNGPTTITLMVVTVDDLQVACHYAARGDQQATKIASAVTQWMTEAVAKAEPEQNAQCLVCAIDFGMPPLEIPAAVCLANNFRDTHSMVSGVCEKCFAQAQAAGDPLEYLTKYFRDLWPDMQVVDPGNA